MVTPRRPRPSSLYTFRPRAAWLGVVSEESAEFERIPRIVSGPAAPKKSAVSTDSTIIPKHGRFAIFGASPSGLSMCQAHVIQNRYDFTMVRNRKRTTGLEAAVVESYSIAGVLRRLGLRVAGGNYKTIQAEIRRLGLSTAHWTGQAHLRGRRHTWAVKTPPDTILVEESTYRGGTSKLKSRLVAAGLLREACAKCGVSEWHGERLSLHLDHVNGRSTDNRIENLRLLCPNCHSLTPTYCGKNKRGRPSTALATRAPLRMTQALHELRSG
jgi:hypothetical protein